MLIGLVGDFGTGKTLFTTMVALDSERRVLANYHLNIEDYEYVEPIDVYRNLGYNCDLLLDEIYTWLESRTSHSFLNRYVSYIVLQSRHRTIDIYGTLQLLSSADLRFRDLLHIIIKCTRKNNGNKDPDKWDFLYEFMKVSTGFRWNKRLPYEEAKEFFQYFDTNEIVEPYDKDFIEFELLKRYPRKMAGKLRAVAKEIADIREVYTHDSLKLTLMDYGFDPRYEPLVYVILKGG